MNLHCSYTLTQFHKEQRSDPSVLPCRLLSTWHIFRRIGCYRFTAERHVVAMCVCSKGARAANNRAATPALLCQDVTSLALAQPISIDALWSSRSRFSRNPIGRSSQIASYSHLNSLILHIDLTVALLFCAC